MLISRCHIRLPLASGKVYHPATRWPLHLAKGPLHSWNFQKIPQKCNFNCYLCQSFRWLGPDLVPCGGQMWSSIVLTMRWFQSVDTSRFTSSRTRQCQFCAVDEGALPPTTPVNPYLGWRARKKWAIFYFLNTITIHLNLHFFTKTTFRGPTESPKVPVVSNWARGLVQPPRYWKG